MKNKSFITAYTLRTVLLLCFASFTGTAFAQCLVNSLIVTTGTNNGLPVGQGNNDPHWNCINKTGVYTMSAPPPPAAALIVSPASSWAGGGTWIADNQMNAAPGLVTTSVSTLTFEREFRMCADDEVVFDLRIRADGLIADILVDGVSAGLSQATSNYGGLTSIWTPIPFTQFLTAGAHTLQIVVSNPIAQTPNRDPIGFFLNGTVASVNNSIINDQDPTCTDFACESRCDEECYWTVDGNNIISGRNILGTLTNDDIRIVTNGNATPDRGVIAGGNAATGGYLGWNTIAPTARVHIDCRNGNNPTNVIGQPSDVRFENLEPGSGFILAIDAQGYVYNTWVPIDGRDPQPDGMSAANDDVVELKEELRELKMQLADLRRTIATGAPQTVDIATGSTLYQNAPNPFDTETRVGYNVVSMKKSAFIILYDLNGRELTKYEAQQGEGAITISANTMQPGIYLYSLVVDGREVETKRMILSR